MNIYDIAKKANVSVATVSRVINGSKYVSDKTKAKVQQIMNEEGYIPNIFARGLNFNSIKTIGILCPAISDINHAKPVSIIEKLLSEKGYGSLLCCLSSNEEDKSKYLNLLLHKKVDAIIIIGSTVKEAKNNKKIESIAKQVPIIIINGLIKLPNVYCVLCDEELAVFELVVSLAKNNHRDIVYIYDTNTYSGYQKLAGFYKGLEACGISKNQQLIIKIPDIGNEFDLAYNEMKRVIESNISFSAVVGADDTIAIGALKALNENKISIPVIGFNNTEFAKYSTPSLTSVDNMMPSICKAAIDILFSVLSGMEESTKVVLSPRIVERESYRL